MHRWTLLFPAMALLLFRFSLGQAAEEAVAPRKEACLEREALRRTSQTFRTVARQAGPAVVHIRCRLPRHALELVGQRPMAMEQNEEYGEERIPISSGSGIVIDAAGYILTSYHVVRNAVDIRVTLADRRAFEAELISFDPLSDLAMLQIEADQLTVALLGDSDAAEVGDWVVTIGSPLGLQQTVTSGIISATGRDFLGRQEDDSYVSYQNFIQTDAAIYEGSSGGPLLNLDGEVIAITHSTAFRSVSGLAFATPINLAKNVLDAMKKGLGAPRGRLGVGLHDVDQAIAASSGLERIYGAQVQFVERDSPAAHAHLRTGDIILAVNGREVRSRAHLRSLIACAPLGERLSLTYWREDDKKHVEITLHASPILVVDRIMGMALMNLNKVAADQLGLESPQGALVISVMPKGVAAAAGIRPGMVVAVINAVPTPDINAYKAAQRKYADTEEIQLGINVRGKLRLVRFDRSEAGRLTPRGIERRTE